jgi:hypothetical protein
LSPWVRPLHADTIARSLAIQQLDFAKLALKSTSQDDGACTLKRRIVIAGFIVIFAVGALIALFVAPEREDITQSAARGSAEATAGPDQPPAPTGATSPVPRAPAPPTGILSVFEGEAGVRYRVTNLQVQYHDLVRKASSGDLVAARTLADALMACKPVPRSPRALQERLTKVRDGKLVSNIAIEQALAARCGELTNDEIATRSDWIALLAEAGDSAARLAYPFSSQPRNVESSSYAEDVRAFRENAERMLQEEIEKGSTDALSVMARAHLHPIIKGVTAPFEPNEAKAYAYYYAMLRTLNPSDSRAGEIRRTLQRLEGSLGPDVVARAEEEGYALYRRCCGR